MTAAVCFPTHAHAAPPSHYTVNLHDDYTDAVAVGFDLMDVSSKSVMDSLPSGARGLFWIGNYSNTTCAFSLSDSQVATIADRNRGDPKFSGIYYIADEPHTSNCPSAPADVAARTALVHSHDKNAKTFAIVLDGSNHRGEYKAFANSADYIGVDPYPCNVYNLAAGCDYTAMRNKIKAALTYVPANRMVPVPDVWAVLCKVQLL